MMKDYVEALEMCKKQALTIARLQKKQKELEAEKQEADEAYDDARQHIEFLQKKNESLEKRLAIATKALEEISETDWWWHARQAAKQALKEIKEVKND